MKNYFIINPMAGQGKGIDKLIKQINTTSTYLGENSIIYITESIGDGEKYARRVSQEAYDKNEKIRVFPCGGDGTLNEIINGIFGFHNVSCGCIPLGTGNDFIRNFGNSKDFLDLESQFAGKTIKTDLIKYEGVIDGKYTTRYCANMFNIGFDCNVVDLTARLKTYPLISGSLAYLIAIIGTLVEKKGARLKVEADGKIIEDGDVLLCAIANGSFCGGGIKSSPQASTSDGLFDLNIIHHVSRSRFVKLFPSYTKGKHIDKPGIEKIFLAKKCKSVKITPKAMCFRLCTDGEISTVGEINMEIVKDAFEFIVPKL